MSITAQEARNLVMGARQRASAGFLALAGAVLAGLGQLVVGDKVPDSSTLPILVATSSMMSIVAGAAYLVFQTLEARWVAWKEFADGHGRGSDPELVTIADRRLGSKIQWGAVLLVIQVVAWSLAAIGYAWTLVGLLQGAG